LPPATGIRSTWVVSAIVVTSGPPGGRWASAIDRLYDVPPEGSREAKRRRERMRKERMLGGDELGAGDGRKGFIRRMSIGGWVRCLGKVEQAERDMHPSGLMRMSEVIKRRVGI
jgi:hypothetical protein